MHKYIYISNEHFDKKKLSVWSAFPKWSSMEIGVFLWNIFFFLKELERIVNEFFYQSYLKDVT